MRIEPPPVVTDAAVALRPLEARDVDAWYAYLTLPAVLEHTSWKLDGRDDLAAIVERAASPSPDAPFRFAIVDASDALLGTIGFPVVTSLHRTAEVAYDLAPAAMGRGIATACCRAVVGWMLDAQGFVRVQATALDTNRASQRVLEKCGFAFEGTLANLKMVRGQPRDFRLYARTAGRP